MDAGSLNLQNDKAKVLINVLVVRMQVNTNFVLVKTKVSYIQFLYFYEVQYIKYYFGGTTPLDRLDLTFSVNGLLNSAAGGQ